MNLNRLKLIIGLLMYSIGGIGTVFSVVNGHYLLGLLYLVVMFLGNKLFAGVI